MAKSDPPLLSNEPDGQYRCHVIHEKEIFRPRYGRLFVVEVEGLGLRSILFLEPRYPTLPAIAVIKATYDKFEETSPHVLVTSTTTKLSSDGRSFKKLSFTALPPQ